MLSNARHVDAIFSVRSSGMTAIDVLRCGVESDANEEGRGGR